MTTVREVITRAAQLCAEASEGQPAPSAYFATDVALPRYNGMIASLFGHGIGPSLQMYWDAASGDTAVNGGLYDVAVYTPERPRDGWRIGVTGAVTVTRTSGYGTIEGGTSATTTGAASWFFRADTGNWVLEEDLGLDDTVYFPADIVHGLQALLAAHLVPVGYAGSQTLIALAYAARQKLEQRYAPRIVGQLDAGLQSAGWSRTDYNINTDI
jgi:hypothetical protein